jgi:glutamate carboxypeptidase
MSVQAKFPATLREHARSLSGDTVAQLGLLVDAESPTGDAQRLGTAALIIERMFASTGATIDRVEGTVGEHLVVSWGHARSSESGHVLLIAHYDTAVPAGTVDDSPFRLRGDTMTGPGVYDMKGAIVGARLAMRLIAERGRRLSTPVRLVIVNDEEIGSPDGIRVIKEQVRGAIAAIGLEPALPGGALKVGRRGVARVQLSVTGVESHSGLDAAAGVSAIDELVDQLVWARKVVPPSSGAHLNLGTISGGTRANVVAGRARAELGLRFDSVAAETTALAQLAGLTAFRAGASVDVQLLSHRQTWEPSADNTVASELIARAKSMGIELGTGVSGGAGDTNFVGNTRVPTVDGMGPDGAGAHGPKEWASLASLLDRAALLADYLAYEPRENSRDKS